MLKVYTSIHLQTLYLCVCMHMRRLMGNYADALKDLEDAQHKAPSSNAIKMTLASM